VVDIELGNGTDAEIWKHASQHDCVVISKDEDSSATGCDRKPVAEDRSSLESGRAHHRSSLRIERKVNQETPS
jgi:hypothetical protein